ncbi:MAG: hypothetical protein ACTH0Y_03435 [Luteimonas sp.]
MIQVKERAGGASHAQRVINQQEHLLRRRHLIDAPQRQSTAGGRPRR